MHNYSIINTDYVFAGWYQVRLCDHGKMMKIDVSNLRPLPSSLIGSLALECTLNDIRLHTHRHSQSLITNKDTCIIYLPIRSRARLFNLNVMSQYDNLTVVIIIIIIIVVMLTSKPLIFIFSFFLVFNQLMCCYSFVMVCIDVSPLVLL